MNPVMMEKWIEAATELWGENPELRRQYSNDFQAYLNTVRLRAEWQYNPDLRTEFGGDVDRFLIYKKHEAAGDFTMTTGRTI